MSRLVADLIAGGMADGVEPIHIACSVLRSIRLYNRGPKPVDLGAQLSVRGQLLVACNNRPHCWLCGLRIFLDEPSNSDAMLTLDHVVPKCAGGTRAIDNIKLAHALCNSSRHDPLTHRGRKRVERMKQYLRKRMRSEAA